MEKGQKSRKKRGTCNIRSIFGLGTLKQLTHEMKKNEYDIIALQETKIKDTEISEIDEFLVCNSRGQGRQIDHVLIEHRREQCISNIRTYRGPNVNTDYFLLGTKLVQQIPRKPEKEKTRQTKIKWNTTEQDEEQRSYVKEVRKGIANLNGEEEMQAPKQKYNSSYKKGIDSIQTIAAQPTRN
ncbi:hypothetical protein ILUMI_09913 [Ignelater luminosus]|uniref:Endonuclease/exonuclease/phosphatase domain-containing protein n=1 Tax=Ignelater luminosus TaxID=2038154 RepID=A0A8K0CYV4_IGNLU|nr:hypothetical protein ILUMI_09913 [Ignelater luminosus]